MKTEAVYKRAYNVVLGLVGDQGRDTPLPSENQLSARVGVSRTTMRKIVRQLEANRIVITRGAARVVVREPDPGDAFPASETVPAAHQIESRFMTWMLRDERKQGTPINAFELAREFGVSTTSVREFLNRFSRFGLIERRPNAHWVFKGFNEDFALELFDIREMFELRSALAFARLPSDAPQWSRLTAMRRDHVRMLDEIDARYQQFSTLDDHFHRLIHEASSNRFIDDFYDVIAIVFHYHYQWNKQGEKQRNGVALGEHLAYIDALRSRDVALVEKACRAHLLSARNTLMSSLRPPR